MDAHKQILRLLPGMLLCLAIGRPLVCAAQTATTVPGISEPRVVFDPGRSVFQLQFADVDGDGRQDAIFLGSMDGGSAVFVALNDGNLPFGSSPIQISEAGNFTALALADLNGDGRVDIAAIAKTSTSRIYLNTASGSASFTAETVDSVYQYNSSVAAADVNGDGRVDIVVSRSPDALSRNALYLNNGTASPFAGVAAGTIGTDSAMGPTWLVDMNKDGRADALVHNSAGNLVAYLNDASADPFSAVSPVIVATHLSSQSQLLIQDFNGDGRADLLVATQGVYDRVESEWTLYVNTGSATTPFATATAIAHRGGLGILCLPVAGDMNTDGRVDLTFVCSGVTQKVATGRYTGNVYLNDGSQTPFAQAHPVEIMWPYFTSTDQQTAAYATIGGKPALLVATSRTSTVPGIRMHTLVDDQPPVAANDSATALRGQGIEIDVYANDRDADGKIVPESRRVVTQTSKGALTATDKGFTYQAPTDFSGVDSFQYVVQDNNAVDSNVATVSINVKKPGGGGGSMEWIALSLLASCVLFRKARVVSNGGSVDRQR